MTQYRKKPIVVEAMRYLATSDKEYNTAFDIWVRTNQGKRYLKPRYSGASMFISTREGVMEASAGDWIICGIKGELYPCKSDVFDLTYEPVA